MKTLAQIQKQLKAPKSQWNDFSKYYYRNAEDILEALKVLLDDDDIFKLTEDMIMLGDRYYIKATATFNEHSATAFAREEQVKKGMDSAQITGATSSYARKYALNALFAIDDTKDPDSQEQEKSAPKDPKAPEQKKVATKVKELTLAEKQKRHKDYTDCLAKIVTTEMYAQVRDMKEKWVEWVNKNISPDDAVKMATTFLELEAKYQPKEEK